MERAARTIKIFTSWNESGDASIVILIKRAVAATFGIVAMNVVVLFDAPSYISGAQK